MLTRRRFLSYSGAGILAATAGCSPQNVNWLLNQDETASNANTTLSLAEKAKLKKLKQFF